MKDSYKKMQTLVRIFLLILSLTMLLLPVQAGQKAIPNSRSSSTKELLSLIQATICEQVKDGTVRNAAVVFSIAKGRVYCFTDFDPVPGKMYIYHKWYRRDILTSKVKLSLRPPRWSTFSYINIRETDKGPWRVEIVDEQSRTYRILRFSITD